MTMGHEEKDERAATESKNSHVLLRKGCVRRYGPPDTVDRRLGARSIATEPGGQDADEPREQLAMIE